MHKKKGKLIVVEGLDGSGKQTQTALLLDWMNQSGHRAVSVSFPNYEKPSSAMTKKYLRGDYNHAKDEKNPLQFIKQMSLFYAADRVSSFNEIDEQGSSIMQLLDQGVHVICDRYTTSNVLHQSGNLGTWKQASPYIDWVEELEYKQLGLPRPNLVLYLDVVPEVSERNIASRANATDIHENINHLRQVHRMKDRIIDKCGWTLIPCCYQGNMLTTELIHRMIVTPVERSLTGFVKS